ncbi:Ser-Thr-rich glycosyl-phosphatidyl-inositol-anchored membrane family-domain-containing protein [Aspergillus varians]
MRSVFFLALSAIATLVAARENSFNIPKDGYAFTAGEATTLSWTPSTQGTVSLRLQWGSAFTSSTGTTIASNIPNSGSYTWSVPSEIADKSDYTVEIISDSDTDSTNYLPRFSIEGADATATTTSTTTTTETSTTESSSTTTATTLKTSTSTTTTESSSTSPTPTSTSTKTSSEDSSKSSSESPSETPTSTTTAESSTTSTESTESATDSPTSVPSVNDEAGSNAGMTNRVSSGLLALALGVAALI